MGLVLISQLYNEGRITDEERDNLKGILIHIIKWFIDLNFFVDMIFSDDVILLSFFSRYEGEEEDLKDAIVKYGKGGVMES